MRPGYHARQVRPGIAFTMCFPSVPDDPPVEIASHVNVRRHQIASCLELAFSHSLCRYVLVPWDVAPQFDLIIPAQPADVDYIMLFMSGHLMFFRHSPYVWEQFLHYYRLQSLEAFLGAPYHWIDMGAGKPSFCLPEMSMSEVLNNVSIIRGA